MKKYAPTVLRIGIALVFMWFGFQQFTNPEAWISYLPKFVTHITPLDGYQIILLDGVFELVFASALLLGYYTRFTALILALHLLDITFIVGFDAVGVRDFGLSLATIAIFMFGSSPFSLDDYKSNEVTNTKTYIAQ